MKHSSLVISVTEAGDFEVNIHGVEANLFTMLGACEYAKNWLMQTIQKEKGDEHTQYNPTGDCKTNEDAYTDCITVSKQEAMNALLEARQTLEQRLQTIVRADDRAQFMIPRNLSSL